VTLKTPATLNDWRGAVGGGDCANGRAERKLKTLARMWVRDAALTQEIFHEPPALAQIPVGCSNARSFDDQLGIDRVKRGVRWQKGSAKSAWGWIDQVNIPRRGDSRWAIRWAPSGDGDWCADSRAENRGRKIRRRALCSAAERKRCGDGWWRMLE